MRIPNHVGIIMDGNGRWAKERGLVRSMGHKAGSNNLKQLATYIYDKGVKYLSVYAFSVDNFKREQAEVDYLMNLFVQLFEKEFAFLMEKGIRVVISGRRENLSDKVLKSIDKITEKTRNNQNGVFNICLNYSGQFELIDALDKIIDNKVDIKGLSREDLYHYLYQDLPPLDLVIRTSGEQRISDFMIYQSAYAEYYFTKTYFPDFSEKEFDEALLEYNKRERRYGGIKK